MRTSPDPSQGGECLTGFRGINQAFYFFVIFLKRIISLCEALPQRFFGNLSLREALPSFGGAGGGWPSLNLLQQDANLYGQHRGEEHEEDEERELH